LYVNEDELVNSSFISNGTTSISTKIKSNESGVLKNSTNDNQDKQEFNISTNSVIFEANFNGSFNKSPMRDSSQYSMFRDKLYTSKCICIISQYPFNNSFKKILSTLYDMVEKTDLLGINLESHLYNIIYELPMPEHGKLVKFNIGCTSVVARMPDYVNGNELPLLDYDLFEFFRLLGVNNIIMLYIAALLEHQILLYSKDYNLLMLVAESLTALFFPFTWLKPYVPIVPASNLHFIEAPVPYIMGFHHKDIDKDFFRQGIVLKYLNENN
jgi:hypothetical protein